MNAGTAGLRIKFIPVMKDCHKDNSKCCLEIIPEISGVQNIDRIQWKEENNSLEYIIPMTYKIILKKLPMHTKEMNDNLNKIYYSCVDLLLPSSITSLNLGSGDVKRIISDTYIVTKVTADVDNINSIQELGFKHDEEGKQREPTNNQSINGQKLVSTELIKSSINKDQTREDNKTHNSNNKASEKTSSQNTFGIINVNKESIDQITNTESDFALYTDACTQSGETITCLSTIMNSSKEYCSKQLSQSPICSVDTDLAKENDSAKSVMYYINEISKGAACIANICTIDNINHDNYARNKVITEQIKSHGYPNIAIKEFTRRKRILPEIRVAELVQVMEKEIMPLKILLNEILTKCATLGLTWTKQQQISLMYKPINPKRSDPIKQCTKPFKSNRVVYSIIFEG